MTLQCAVFSSVVNFNCRLNVEYLQAHGSKFSVPLLTWNCSKKQLRQRRRMAILPESRHLAT